MKPTTEEQIIAEIKQRWGRRSYTTPEGLRAVPAVRDGGLTDQLIRLAVRRTLVAINSIEPCPECAQGKHPNCDGSSWDEDADAPAECPCYARNHEPPQELCWQPTLCGQPTDWPHAACGLFGGHPGEHFPL